MRKLFIVLIKLYQKIPGPWHGACRFTPTCSDYAIQAFELHGTIKGLGLTIWRLMRCNPFCKGGYDPVPLPKSKKTDA